jgi:hypothetical protein
VCGCALFIEENGERASFGVVVHGKMGAIMKNLLTRIFLGLRFRLLLLVLLACAPLVALAWHSAWEDRRRQLADW